MILRRKRRIEEETEEREVFRFFDPEEWDAPKEQPKAETDAAGIEAALEEAMQEPWESGESGELPGKSSEEQSLENLLADVDGEINGEKYINIFDDDEVSKEEIDDLVHEEQEKRGLVEGRPQPSATEEEDEDEDGDSEIYVDDLVSNNDPLIAQLEEEAKKLAEEEAAAPLTRRERRALEAARREKEQARAEAERAASKAAARRGAVGQIEAERQRIYERMEAEAAARKVEEKRIARRKAARRKRAKGRGPLAVIGGIILGVMTAAVVLALMLVIMGVLGKSELLNTKAAQADMWVPEGLDAVVTEEGTILYKEAEYRFASSRTNILLLTLDSTGDSGRMIDSMLLLSLDTKTGESTAISIPGDTVTDVDLYNADGINLGTRRVRIAEAYRYGGGGRAGCENAAYAVSRLLFGLPVNAYYAVDLRAVNPLADALAGLPGAENPDDGAADDALGGISGTVETTGGTLGDAAAGIDAESYIRSDAYSTAKAYTAEEAAGVRAARQLAFLDSFLRQTVESTKINPLFPLYLFNFLRHYSWTNLNPTRLTYFASLYLRKGFRVSQVITVPGTAIKTENGFNYEVKQKTFYGRVLRALYRLL